MNHPADIFTQSPVRSMQIRRGAFTPFGTHTHTYKHTHGQSANEPPALWILFVFHGWTEIISGIMKVLINCDNLVSEMKSHRLDAHFGAAKCRFERVQVHLNGKMVVMKKERCIHSREINWTELHSMRRIYANQPTCSIGSSFVRSKAITRFCSTFSLTGNWWNSTGMTVEGGGATVVVGAHSTKNIRQLGLWSGIRRIN